MSSWQASAAGFLFQLGNTVVRVARAHRRSRTVHGFLPELPQGSACGPKSVRLNGPEYIDATVPELVRVIRIVGIDIDRARRDGRGCPGCPQSGRVRKNERGRPRDGWCAERRTRNDTVITTRISRDDIHTWRIHVDLVAII